MEGSILLHRKLLDSEVFASEKRLKVWLWLLLRAAYKERHIPIIIGKGESIITIQRSQLLFGRYKAEETLNIDGSTIYKILQWMQKEEMINIESNSHYTIITINNYDTFQTFGLNEVTANEQPCNNQVTAIKQPSNSRVTHTNKNKQDKQDKQDKKETISFDFITDVEMKQLFQTWIVYRKEIKKPLKTQMSIEACYKNLITLSNNNYSIAKSIVNKSIANQWQGLFALNETEKQEAKKPVSNPAQYVDYNSLLKPEYRK